MSATNDLTSLATPPSCIADFCLIPLGTPTASVSKEVAEVQRVLKKSGLTYSMHSAGTTVGMTLHTPLLHAVCSRVRANSLLGRYAGMAAWRGIWNILECTY